MKERATEPCNYAGIIYQYCKDASCCLVSHKTNVYRPNESHFNKVELPVLRKVLLASLKAMLEKCHKEPSHLDTCLLCPRFLKRESQFRTKALSNCGVKMILLFYPCLKWLKMKMVGFTWAVCLTSSVSSV